MATRNGLIPPSVTHSAPSNSYYALKNDGVLNQATLVSTTLLQSNPATEGLLDVPASIFVPGPEHPTPAYVGAVRISPGGNVAAPDGSAGVVIRATADGTVMEVGTDADAGNQVLVAGPGGLSAVYNELYNQPVALSTITIVGTNPVCAPTGGAEVFRCTQDGVNAADAGPFVFNRIQVPRSGAYTMQTQINMGNGPGASTVVLPSVLVGGVPLWYSLQMSMTEFGTVTTIPYSTFEVLGGDFNAVDTFESNSLTIRTYSTVVFLDATKVYTVGLVSNNVGWNIGSAGQIKVELIAMC